MSSSLKATLTGIPCDKAQKSPSLPRGWNEGLNMVVAFMFDRKGFYHILSDDATKKEKKIENRSTYRASVQVSVCL